MQDFESHLDDELVQFNIEQGMRGLNNLISRCFFNCAQDFHTAQLTSKEELCAYRCTDKFTRTSLRVQRVFQEQVALQQLDAERKQQQGE